MRNVSVCGSASQPVVFCFCYLAESHILFLTTFSTKSYSTCHHSQGIVAAVRRKGGRFLAYDAHNKMFYADIKDKQATEKTSQALRDAKREILPVGIPIPQVGKATELPKELYSSFTDQVLQNVNVAMSSRRNS